VERVLPVGVPAVGQGEKVGVEVVYVAAEDAVDADRLRAGHEVLGKVFGQGLVEAGGAPVFHLIVRETESAEALHGFGPYLLQEISLLEAGQMLPVEVKHLVAQVQAHR